MEAAAVRSNRAGDPISLGAGLLVARAVISCLRMISAGSSVCSQERAITRGSGERDPARTAPAAGPQRVPAGPPQANQQKNQIFTGLR